MGRRVFYKAQRGVSCQLIDQMWQKGRSGFVGNKEALGSKPRTSNRCTYNENSPIRDSPLEAAWSQNGCNEIRNRALDETLSHAAFGTFPTFLTDHILREIYTPQCQTIAELTSTDTHIINPSNFGLLMEITSFATETQGLSEILAEIASEIGLPKAASSSMEDGADFHRVWKVHTFASREADCEKSQAFLIRSCGNDSSTSYSVKGSCMQEWIRIFETRLQDRAANVHISKIRLQESDQSQVSRLDLTSIRHECIVRNVQPLLSSSLHQSESFEKALAEQIRSIEQNGFLNYYPAKKLGIATHEHFPFARAFLGEKFGLGLVSFLKDLEGIDSRLQHIWHDTFQKGENDSVRFLTDLRFLKLISCRLRDFPLHNTHVSPILDSLFAFARSGRPTLFGEVFQSAVAYRFIDAKIRSVSEVCFNSMTSLRIQKHGYKVIPGDLVLPREQTTIWRQWDALSLQVPPSTSFPSVFPIPHNQLAVSKNLVPKLIRDEQHAKEFSLDDVVLPVVFPLKSAKSMLSRHPENQQPYQSTFWPSHEVNRKAYKNFLCYIGFHSGFLSQNQGTQECVAYRHIIAKPISSENRDYVNQKNTFEWEIRPASGGRISSQKADQKPLIENRTLRSASSSTSIDCTAESIPSETCLRSQSHAWKYNHAKANSQLWPILSNSMIVGMQIQLPPDAFLASALREVFQIPLFDRNRDKPSYQKYGSWKRIFRKACLSRASTAQVKDSRQ